MNPPHPRPRVGILGATGYAGRELISLVSRHPSLELAFASSSRADATPEPPALPVDPLIGPLDLDLLEQVDGVFVCTPHGAAAPLVLAALERDCRVVDLSADFRLREPARYASAYGIEHPAPGLLDEAVYGLTEFARADLPGARLVANPGCYPTAALLALRPLLEADLLDLGQVIVIDAKSGLSGAGKAPSATTHFGNVHDNFRAYGVGTHRHAPEIEQGLGTARFTFTPHLLPVMRGILETIHVRPRDGVEARKLMEAWRARYADEPFVSVFERGLPELDRVRGTNACHLGLATNGELVTLVSAIDNLLKGAAGQALQNMNLMLGLAEEDGLW